MADRSSVEHSSLANHKSHDEPQRLRYKAAGAHGKGNGIEKKISPASMIRRDTIKSTSTDLVGTDSQCNVPLTNTVASSHHSVNSQNMVGIPDPQQIPARSLHATTSIWPHFSWRTIRLLTVLLMLLWLSVIPWRFSLLVQGKLLFLDLSALYFEVLSTEASCKRDNLS